MSWISEAAERLKASGVYLGGPPHLFEAGGRRQLMLLLNEGLAPESAVLDIGCGSLRAGYWLIHFLNAGGYCGLEPDAHKYEAACAMLLEPGMAEAKAPQFDSNGELDFSVFGRKFDFFLARSVWTHAPKSAIEKMLDGFVEWGTGKAVFLTSYVRARWWSGDDYSGDDWLLGSNRPPPPRHLTRHSIGWIRSACTARDLKVQEIGNPAFAFGGQTWLKIRRRTAER